MADIFFGSFDLVLEVTHLLLQLDLLCYDLILQDVKLVSLSWLPAVFNTAAFLRYLHSYKQLVQIPESQCLYLLKFCHCVLKRHKETMHLFSDLCFDMKPIQIILKFNIL